MELKISDNIISSIEAEQYVISSILGNNQNYHKVSFTLKPHHFSDEFYSSVYETCGKIIDDNRVVDALLLSENMNLSEDAKKAIQEMGIYGLSCLNIKDYSYIIINRYKRRKVLETVENALIETGNDPSYEFVEEIESVFDELNFDDEKEEEGLDVFSEIEERIKNKGKLLGFSTGISNLDRSMDGWERGGLYTLAGRSGAGKSALMAFFAKHLMEKKIKVGIFSLEMKTNQLKQRILSSLTKVDTQDMRKGNIDVKTFEKLLEYKSIFNHLLISDKSGVTVNYIKSKARSWKKKGCDIIFIDHLLRMKSNASRSDTQAQRIGKITAALKDMAKELDIAIVLLAQLNRETEKRENHRPQISDLKDSGSIEEDSDGVVFIYNYSKYLMNNKPELNSEKYLEWERTVEDKKNKGELIVAKNRHGEECIVDIYMDIPTMTFADLYKENESVSTPF